MFGRESWRAIAVCHSEYGNTEVLYAKGHKRKTKLFHGLWLLEQFTR